MMRLAGTMYFHVAMDRRFSSRLVGLPGCGTAALPPILPHV
jgi:hypothetical protein